MKFQLSMSRAFYLVAASFAVFLVFSANQLVSAKLRHVMVKRLADAPKDLHHHTMHNHMSRKVFDRACAADKDTIDEIIECLTGNDALKTLIKPELAAGCYKESFGGEFDPKEVMKHKEMICAHRDKFEDMTACIYRKTTESLEAKEIEKLTEAMVDVGMCIINALD